MRIKYINSVKRKLNKKHIHYNTDLLGFKLKPPYFVLGFQNVLTVLKFTPQLIK
jgi:hypothetical protein